MKSFEYLLCLMMWVPVITAQEGPTAKQSSSGMLLDQLAEKMELSFVPAGLFASGASESPFIANGLKYKIALTRLGGAVLESPSAVSANEVSIAPLGGSPGVVATAEDVLPGTAFAYIGNDRSRWRNGIPTYRKVRYPNVYPNIDIVYYGDKQRLVFDFVVKPGGNPRDIRLQFGNARTVRLSQKGDVVLETAEGQYTINRPTVYQTSNAARRLVNARFSLDSGTVGFEVAPYDSRQQLIIDPTVDWTIYPAAQGWFADSSQGKAVAIDTNGYIWVTGWLRGDYYNPWLYDIYVAKVTSTGTVLRQGWFGGTNNCYNDGSHYGQEAFGMAADASGGVIVVGWTSCPDYPTQNPYQTYQGNRDVVVTQLTADADLGAFSTYLGGQDEETGYGIAFDPATGSIWVAGRTVSSNFPRVGSSVTHGGGFYDGFVSKFSSGGSLGFSRFLGGSGSDEAYNVTVDPYGNAYLTGLTYSSNFPLVAPTQPARGGSRDAFVTKLSNSDAVLFSTFLGGSGLEDGFGIAVDGSQNIWVGGRTGSTNFPLANPLLSQYRGGSSDAFVSRYAFSGSSYNYAFGTFLGGSDYDVVYGMGLDASDRAWISGQTKSYNWPCTADAFQFTRPGTYAGFVSRVDYNGGNSYTYGFGSYLPTGDPVGFAASRLAIAPSGEIYVSGDRYGYQYGMWLTKITP